MEVEEDGGLPPAMATGSDAGVHMESMMAVQHMFQQQAAHMMAHSGHMNLPAVTGAMMGAAAGLPHQPFPVMDPQVAMQMQFVSAAMQQAAAAAGGVVAWPQMMEQMMYFFQSMQAVAQTDVAMTAAAMQQQVFRQMSQQAAAAYAMVAGAAATAPGGALGAVGSGGTARAPKQAGGGQRDGKGGSAAAAAGRQDEPATDRRRSSTQEDSAGCVVTMSTSPVGASGGGRCGPTKVPAPAYHPSQLKAGKRGEEARRPGNSKAEAPAARQGAAARDAWRHPQGHPARQQQEGRTHPPHAAAGSKATGSRAASMCSEDQEDNAILALLQMSNPVQQPAASGHRHKEDDMAECPVPRAPRTARAPGGAVAGHSRHLQEARPTAPLRSQRAGGWQGTFHRLTGRGALPAGSEGELWEEGRGHHRKGSSAAGSGGSATRAPKHPRPAGSSSDSEGGGSALRRQRQRREGGRSNAAGATGAQDRQQQRGNVSPRKQRPQAAAAGGARPQPKATAMDIDESADDVEDLQGKQVAAGGSPRRVYRVHSPIVTTLTDDSDESDASDDATGGRSPGTKVARGNAAAAAAATAEEEEGGGGKRPRRATARLAAVAWLGEAGLRREEGEDSGRMQRNKAKGAKVVHAAVEGVQKDPFAQYLERTLQWEKWAKWVQYQAGRAAQRQQAAKQQQEAAQEQQTQQEQQPQPAEGQQQPAAPVGDVDMEGQGQHRELSLEAASECVAAAQLGAATPAAPPAADGDSDKDASALRGKAAVDSASSSASAAALAAAAAAGVHLSDEAAALLDIDMTPEQQEVYGPRLATVLASAESLLTSLMCKALMGLGLPLTPEQLRAAQTSSGDGSRDRQMGSSASMEQSKAEGGVGGAAEAATDGAAAEASPTSGTAAAPEPAAAAVEGVPRKQEPEQHGVAPDVCCAVPQEAAAAAAAGGEGAGASGRSDQQMAAGLARGAAIIHLAAQVCCAGAVKEAQQLLASAGRAIAQGYGLDADLQSVVRGYVPGHFMYHTMGAHFQQLWTPVSADALASLSATGVTGRGVSEAALAAHAKAQRLQQLALEQQEELASHSSHPSGSGCGTLCFPEQPPNWAEAGPAVQGLRNSRQQLLQMVVTALSDLGVLLQPSDLAALPTAAPTEQDHPHQQQQATAGGAPDTVSSCSQLEGAVRQDQPPSMAAAVAPPPGRLPVRPLPALSGKSLVVADAASTRQLLRASGLAAALDDGAWLLGMSGDVPGALRGVGAAVQKLLSQLNQGVVLQELGCWLVQWALQVDMLVYHWRGLVTAALAPPNQQQPQPAKVEQQEAEEGPAGGAAEGQGEQLVEGQAVGPQQEQPHTPSMQQVVPAAEGTSEGTLAPPPHELGDGTSVM